MSPKFKSAAEPVDLWITRNRVIQATGGKAEGFSQTIVGSFAVHMRRQLRHIHRPSIYVHIMQHGGPSWESNSPNFDVA